MSVAADPFGEWTPHHVGVFRYAGISYGEAERSMRLVAREVMPELRKLRPEAVAGRAATPSDKPVTVGLLGS